MACVHVHGVHICSHDGYIIFVDGCDYRFIMPYSCGIGPMNRDGTERLSPWPRRVWDAVQAWSDQGRKTDQNGRCIWEAR